jgi:Family of unknown function (DUF6221)
MEGDSVPDVATFLLARIEEDESAALCLSVCRDRVSDRDGASTDPRIVEAGRIDPLWVLADCAARRRIVADHQERADVLRGPAEAFDAGVYAGLAYALRHLAQPYDDHPDFRPEWRL